MQYAFAIFFLSSIASASGRAGWACCPRIVHIALSGYPDPRRTYLGEVNCSSHSKLRATAQQSPHRTLLARSRMQCIAPTSSARHCQPQPLPQSPCCCLLLGRADLADSSRWCVLTAVLLRARIWHPLRHSGLYATLLSVSVALVRHRHEGADHHASGNAPRGRGALWTLGA